MAEAVSAQMQVAQAVIEVEREPLVEPVQEAELSPLTDKATPQQLARQLTMADLFQRHGAQPASRRKPKSQPVTGQQLSLLGAQPASAT